MHSLSALGDGEGQGEVGAVRTMGECFRRSLRCLREPRYFATRENTPTSPGEVGMRAITKTICDGPTRDTRKLGNACLSDALDIRPVVLFDQLLHPFQKPCRISAVDGAMVKGLSENTDRPNRDGIARSALDHDRLLGDPVG